nr:unnamed protein product [Digitaria exilis]
MHHTSAAPPGTKAGITRNQARERGLGRPRSVRRPHHLAKHLHGLSQAPRPRVPADHGVPRHGVRARHSVEHLPRGAHVPGLGVHPDQRRGDEEVGREPCGRGGGPGAATELRVRGARAGRGGEVVRVAVGRAGAGGEHGAEEPRGLTREAQGEVSPEHGVVEERLGRRRGGGGHGGVEGPARGIGVAEADVAGDEEGREVAVGGEAGDDGERVGAAGVGGGVGGGGDGGGEGFLEGLARNGLSFVVAL